MPAWSGLVIPRAIERRLVLLEAFVYLSFARLALRVCSFGQLTWFLERPTCGPELSGPVRIRARKEVRSAILALYRRQPGATTCLHRAIAAQAMLRRRRVGTTLYYGAATLPQQGLTTHAWVEDGGDGVIGHVTARQHHYRVLARYPNLT